MSSIVTPMSMASVATVIVRDVLVRLTKTGVIARIHSGAISLTVVRMDCIHWVALFASHLIVGQLDSHRNVHGEGHIGRLIVVVKGRLRWTCVKAVYLLHSAGDV